MHVAARGSGWRIDIAVCVNPDQTDALLLTTVELGHTAYRSCRDGMISAEYQWNHPLLQRLHHQLGFLDAGSSDLFQVLRVRIAVLLGFRNRNGDVSAIFDDKTERLELGFKPSNPDCGGSHIHTAPGLPQVERHANNTDFPCLYLRGRTMGTRRKLF